MCSCGNDVSVVLFNRHVLRVVESWTPGADCSEEQHPYIQHPGKVCQTASCTRRWQPCLIFHILLFILFPLLSKTNPVPCSAAELELSESGWSLYPSPWDDNVRRSCKTVCVSKVWYCQKIMQTHAGWRSERMKELPPARVQDEFLELPRPHGCVFTVMVYKAWACKKHYMHQSQDQIWWEHMFVPDFLAIFYILSSVVALVLRV